MTLKEATAELHSKAEKREFNQKMLKGELSKEQYIAYLCQQLAIFEAIETDRTLPHPSLNRMEEVLTDIGELKELPEGSHIDIDLLESTEDYYIHLKSLSEEEILPHIYLNYLALVYGGQMMKSKVPGSGRMYDFENMQECVGSIREIQKDEWADEVNKGFIFIINILDELQRTTR